VWRRDFTGGCGLLSMILADRDAAARARFVDALALFGIGFSWGGFESLVVPFDPATVRSVAPWPDDSRGVRLSIGLEDPDDLIADLEQAFAAMDRA
jgi:cystathionine beta-lyase